MIPVYICDDEQNICNHISQLVEKQILIQNYDMGPVYTSKSSAELLSIHQKDSIPAIYLLDVDLQNDFDGFALAAEIRKRDPRGYIIFITGHPELSFETFRYRLEAMDYIVKGDENVLQSRLHDCLMSIQQRLQNERAYGSQYYTIKIFDTIRHIPVHQLLYFEANGKQHRISLHTDNEILNFFGSLQTIEKEFGNTFFRTHRSYLVNRQRIVRIYLKEQLVELDNGEICFLSRSAKKGLQQSM